MNDLDLEYYLNKLKVDKAEVNDTTADSVSSTYSASKTEERLSDKQDVIVPQAHIADASVDLGDVVTKFNTLLLELEALGLLNSS